MTTSINRAFETTVNDYQVRLSGLSVSQYGTGNTWSVASNNNNLWLVGVSNGNPDTKTLQAEINPLQIATANSYGITDDKLVMSLTNCRARLDPSAISGGLGMYFTDVDITTGTEDRINSTSWSSFYNSTAVNVAYRGSQTSQGAFNSFANTQVTISGDTANNNSNGLHSSTLSLDVRLGSIPTPYVNSQLTNSATLNYYWEGQKFIFDGNSGDSIETFDDIKSTVTVTGNVIQGFQHILESEMSFATEAKNTVGFPFTGEQLYIEDGYIETGASYAGNAINNYDYVLDGYAAVGYFEEQTLASANSLGISTDDYFETISFTPESDTMLQDLASDFQMAPVLMGQLFDSGTVSFDSETDTTVEGKRIQQLSASVNSETTASFSGGRIFDIAETLQSETTATADSGRLQQIAADLVSQTQQTSVPFLLKGGLGIVAGASAIFTEGGYLQSSGALTLRADAEVTTGSNANANLGIILKGFTVTADSETQTQFSGGKIYSINENLLAQSELTGVPGYLFSGEAGLSSDFATQFNAGLSFLAPQAFMESQFTVPTFLAGFRLLGVANLVSNSGQLAAGKKWLVDPYRRLLVKPETRLSVIPLENALFTVESEKRLNTIIEETNNIIVKQETRNYHIPQAPIVFVSDTRTERV